jgi:DNA-binding SARP family transcriptional activator
MKKKVTPIAKITRPKLSGILGRVRLFRLLDQGRRKPVVWVAAQAGSGKTTLVASWLDARKLPCLWYQIDESDGDIASFFHYMGMAAQKAAPRLKKPFPILTSEYLQGIPVFTRHYFEELFRRLKPPSVVILDNYQDAAHASGFHDMIVHGLDTVPEGITVIILSRAAPPHQLARLQANNRLHLIGWDDIRFTREESRGLLRMQGQGKSSSEALELLHNKTEGWAAGLILLTTGAGGTAPPSQAPEGMAGGALFDYFASEIFSKTDPPIQDVLLKTSFLQKIDPAAAEKLTENGKAGQILERLSRDHYFTQKYGQTYQYHPLFQTFLQTRAKSRYSPTDVSSLQRSAACLLKEGGRIEEAVGLFIDAADWSGAMSLLVDHAATLISQGRSKTLEGWLSSLPGEHIDGSPWALYWLGICRMPFDPCESRGILEKAFERFKVRADAAGSFLSWSSIVDTFVYEWGDFSPLDRWIVVLENLLLEHPRFPSSDIEARVAAGMLCAMTYRQPYRADLPVWAERVRQVVLKHPSSQLRIMLGNYLIIYYLWIGDFARAGLVIETLRPVSSLKENDPLTRQHWHVMEAMYSWFAADGKTCMQAVTNGLKNAEDSGIHLLDLYLLGQGVYSGLSLGDPSAAGACLDRMSGINSPRLLDKSFYHYQASSVAWYYGDLKKAIEHGKLAVKLAEDVGSPFALALCLVELALALFDDGQYEEAFNRLAQGAESGRGMNSIEHMCLLHGARFAFDRGHEKQGLDLLKRALARGSQQGYLNIPRWDDRNMTRLYAKALEQGIEVEYVQGLIRKRCLVPDDQVANWPWPMKIHTLGRFELTRDGEPVTFSGKVQQKPLALLKILISFGGKDVAAEQFIDALWPDADGDLAHKSFEMTVQRLRRLIGNDKAIQLQERRLSLDASLCWIDVWGLEDLIEKVDVLWKNGHSSRDVPEEALQLSEKAITLYKGHFLPADSAHAWVLSFRERLRSKFLRVILKLGSHRELNLQWEKAAEVFQKGLEVDGLAEEFYQHLMLCYQQLDRRAEAVAVYNRCQEVLISSIGIPPSQKTEDLYQSIIKNKS